MYRVMTIGKGEIIKLQEIGIVNDKVDVSITPQLLAKIHSITDGQIYYSTLYKRFDKLNYIYHDVLEEVNRAIRMAAVKRIEREYADNLVPVGVVIDVEDVDLSSVVEALEKVKREEKLEGQRYALKKVMPDDIDYICECVSTKECERLVEIQEKISNTILSKKELNELLAEVKEIYDYYNKNREICRMRKENEWLVDQLRELDESVRELIDENAKLKRIIAKYVDKNKLPEELTEKEIEEIKILERVLKESSH